LLIEMMNKLEFILIRIVISVLCPLLLFVMFWWVAALLTISGILPIPDNMIAMVAFAGLAIGVLLDLRYVKTWTACFYTVDKLVMGLLFLGCSLIAVALFMGFPVGNLILGMLAGVYTGRRLYHANINVEAAVQSMKKVSLFTGLVTSIEALPVGLLTLQEDWVDKGLRSVIRMESAVISSVIGVALIIFLCVVLVGIQYLCTIIMARIALGRIKDVT
jgi:hypothetical protein